MFGQFEELFNDPIMYCAGADWKAEPGDVLLSLRDRWGSQYPLLADNRLDSLTENYAAGSCEDYLAALGQELSVIKLRLYRLPAKADQYCLAVVGEHEVEDFQIHAEQRQCIPQLLFQARRELGRPAKRLAAGKRLAHREVSLNCNGLIPVGGFAVVERWRANPCGWIALDHWPPVEQPIPSDIEVHRIVRADTTGIGAALCVDRSSRDTRLRIGYDLPDFARWKAVESERPFHCLSKMSFVGDDLFVAYENEAWLVPAAASGKCSFQSLAKVPANKEFEFPAFARSGDGRSWLLLAGLLFECSGGQLRQTEWPLRRSVDFSATPTTCGFAYVSADGR